MPAASMDAEEGAFLYSYPGAVPGLLPADAAAAAAPLSAGTAFRQRFRNNPAVFNVLLVADPSVDLKVPVASADLARWSPWFINILDQRSTRSIDLGALHLPCTVPPVHLETLVASLYDGCIQLDPDNFKHVMSAADAMQIDIACAACEAYLLRKARTLAAAGDVAALCSCAQLASTFHLVSACEEMIPHLVPLVLQQHCDLGLLRSTLAELGSSTGQIAALRHSGLGDSLLAALVLSVAAADGSAAQVPPVKRTRSGGSRGGSEGAPGPGGANSKGLDVLELLQLVDWGGMRPVELGALLQQASASCPGPVTDAMGRLVGNAPVRGSERSGGFGSRLLGLLHGNSEGSAFRDYVKWATRELQVQALCTAGHSDITLGLSGVDSTGESLPGYLRCSGGIYFFTLSPAGAAMSAVISIDEIGLLGPGEAMCMPGLLSRWQEGGFTTSMANREEVVMVGVACLLA